jgi:hypothetical protein
MVKEGIDNKDKREKFSLLFHTCRWRWFHSFSFSSHFSVLYFKSVMLFLGKEEILRNKYIHSIWLGNGLKVSETLNFQCKKK